MASVPLLRLNNPQSVRLRGHPAVKARCMQNLQSVRPLAGPGQPLQYLQQQGCVYLDYNATTPIFPEVIFRNATRS